MDKNKFTKDDKEKFVEFLNMVAKKAKFELNTEEVIKYFKLLSHMQQVMLKKVDANILEVLEVVEPEDSEPGEKHEES